MNNLLVDIKPDETWWTQRLTRVTGLVSSTTFPGYRFQVTGSWVTGLITVHVEYEEADVMSGVEETQHGRRWIIEHDATDMAVIQTCFKALLTSLEHRARENFTYDGRAILQPHYDLNTLMAISPARSLAAEPIPFEK